MLDAIFTRGTPTTAGQDCEAISFIRSASTCYFAAMLNSFEYHLNMGLANRPTYGHKGDILRPMTMADNGLCLMF
mgnify:CR=1 FL=1